MEGEGASIASLRARISIIVSIEHDPVWVNHEKICFPLILVLGSIYHGPS
jgi:hypothetical protein